MSGILGFIDAQYKDDARPVLKKMLERIRHRGPDSEGFYVDDEQGLGLAACLHTANAEERRSIQPLASHDGQLTLVFSGAISNRELLREELEFFGHEIEEDSDAGLVLASYRAWGSEMLSKIDGIFSWALWDAAEQTLTLVRDRFGVEPLYYSQASDDGSFFFASEIKAFLDYPAWEKSLNPKALRSYLSMQYSATHESFFAGVYKLPPASILTYRKGKLTVKRYWTYDFHGSASSFDSAVAQIQETMDGAVARSLEGIEKLGSFLSGGIDSSYIAALALPEKSFTVGFEGYEGQFNEAVYGLELAELLGIEHHVRLLNAEECMAKLPTIQYHLDEPQANLSTIPLYFLAEMAAKHVDVVLSGEGADELFGGYDSYRDTNLMRRYKKIPFKIRRRIARLARFVPHAHTRSALLRAGQSLEESFVGEAQIFSDREALALLKPPYRLGPKATDLTAPIYAKLAGESELTKKQGIDLDLFMPADVLLKADKMTAAHGLQVRVPFLDLKVVQLAESLPEDFRVQGLTTKVALRTAALEKLPPAWAKRPKAGFMVPLKDWLRQDDFGQKVRTVFSRPYVDEFFDQKALLALLDAHVRGEGDYQRKIYTLLAFLLWYEEYFMKR